MIEIESNIPLHSKSLTYQAKALQITELTLS